MMAALSTFCATATHGNRDNTLQRSQLSRMPSKLFCHHRVTQSFNCLSFYFCVNVRRILHIKGFSFSHFHMMVFQCMLIVYRNSELLTVSVKAIKGLIFVCMFFRWCYVYECNESDPTTDGSTRCLILLSVCKLQK